MNKKIIYLLILAILFCFSSCSNGSEEMYTVWHSRTLSSEFEYLFGEKIPQGYWKYSSFTNSEYEDNEIRFSNSSLTRKKMSYSQLVAAFTDYVQKSDAESYVDMLLNYNHGFIALRDGYSDSTVIVVK